MRYKFLVVLLLMIPALAFAQPQVVRTVDLITPPGSATFGIAHVEELRDGNARGFHAIVSTAEGSGELTFDGRTLLLGDGYTVVRETLANTRGALVQRLTATTPAGASESMIVVQNRQTGESSSVGADRYALLLQDSADARIATQVLPLVTRAPHATGGLSTKNLIGDCLNAEMAFSISVLMVEVNCLSGIVPGCAASIAALIGATDGMISNCWLPAYDDTFGWL